MQASLHDNALRLAEDAPFLFHAILAFSSEHLRILKPSDQQYRRAAIYHRQRGLQLYRKAAALAYVSWCGPENLPPLEAFALGCPVVASDIPGADEQLGGSAILVDPGSPDAIAAALAKVISSSETRADMIKRGRKHAMRWTARHYVDGAFDRIDSFAPILRCWKEDAP